MEDFVLTDEIKIKFEKELRDSLEIYISPCRSYLIAIAIHKDHSKNLISKLSCRKGVPFGGYVFDSKDDCYHVECVDYLHLGFTPISFLVKMKGCSEWNMRVPMPEAVVKKCLTPLQKKELRNFKNHFGPEEYTIEYIQMIDAN